MTQIDCIYPIPVKSFFCTSAIKETATATGKKHLNTEYTQRMHSFKLQLLFLPPFLVHFHCFLYK